MTGGALLRNIRWTRGFVRIWIVISLLWIAFSAAENWDAFQQATRPVFRVTLEGKPYIIRGAADEGAAKYAFAKFREELAKDPWAVFGWSYGGGSPLKIMPAAGDSVDFIPFLKMAFIPPAVMLAILFTFRWMILGFTAPARPSP